MYVKHDLGLFSLGVSFGSLRCPITWNDPKGGPFSSERPQFSPHSEHSSSVYGPISS